MEQKQLERVLNTLNSINQSVQFEDTQQTYGSEVLNNITQAYKFIIGEKFEEDMTDSDLIRANNFIRNAFSNSYRTGNVRIKGRDENPLHPFEIPTSTNRLLYLISSANSENTPEEKAAISQGFIYYAQPFDDGNKRTGKLVMDKILLENGLYSPEFKNRDHYLDTLLSISRNLKKDKTDGVMLENIGSFDPLIDIIREEQKKYN